MGLACPSTVAHPSLHSGVELQQCRHHPEHWDVLEKVLIARWYSSRGPVQQYHVHRQVRARKEVTYGDITTLDTSANDTGVRHER